MLLFLCLRDGAVRRRMFKYVQFLIQHCRLDRQQEKVAKHITMYAA
ncbi:unnamed protein product [Mycetohabitans rhizoxinica HKI 454]|uniref:Uncharacterized protein n=1 Tax=Mycetohabitans rhizoxinica (strain DSM 19002 / CIP 109453 / HKI 454) TaxID=882378 RepID=E5APY1_MYCRK|nr:unnamed protein product [Mycetohabitans rhizoxinica HKI 454]